MFLRISMHVCISMYDVCMYVYFYVYSYINIHIHLSTFVYVFSYISMYELEMYLNLQFQVKSSLNDQVVSQITVIYIKVSILKF